MPSCPTPAASSRKPAPSDRTSLQKRKRVWFFAPAALLADVSAWLLMFLSLSKLTGSYNLISASSLVVPIAVTILAISLVGAYRYRTDFASLGYASEHLIACICAYPVAAFLLYVVTSFGASVQSSRGIFTLALILFAPATLLIRRVYWFLAARSRSEGKFLVIADERLGPVFHRDYEASGQHQALRYVAALRELRGKPVAGEGTPAPIVEAAHLLPYLDRENTPGYEAVVLAADQSRLGASVVERLGVINFEDLPVYTMESFYENYWKRLPLEQVGPSWPLEAEFTLVHHSVYSSVKRLLDVVLALLALLLMTPLLLLVALAILLLDGWPVIYSQPRTGLHRVSFKLYKFRTMRVGSDKGDSYTRDGDKRITPLGNFLRKTRLDEFPQLWNVVRGDMSLIGPRAEWVRLVEGYQREIPHYHFRHLIRPGITGWAQVNYPYGASVEDTLKKLSYDLFYIRNFSLRLDGEVILKTLHVIFFGKGR